MRKELGKALRDEFDARLKKLYPQFVQEKVIPNPLGCRLYVWRMRDELKVFLQLYPSNKEDCFTIEIGSSDQLGFDELGLFFGQHEFPPVNTRSRLPLLYTRPRNDYWWYLSNRSTIYDDFFTFQEDPIGESLTKIEPALNEVFDNIERYAIPYFQSLNDSFQ